MRRRASTVARKTDNKCEEPHRLSAIRKPSNGRSPSERATSRGPAELSIGLGGRKAESLEWGGEIGRIS